MISLLFPYKNGDMFGLKNEKGKIIVNPIFDHIRFNENDDIPIIATLPNGNSFKFCYASDDMAVIERDDCVRKLMTIEGNIVDPKILSYEEAEKAISELNERIRISKLDEENKKISANNQMHPNEYKRTCRMCGKTWYSSKERESTLVNHTKGSPIHDFIFIFSGGSSDGLNIIEQQAELELYQLRSCPNCKSTNFDLED